MVNKSGPLGAPKSCELDENTILVPSGDHAGSVPPLTNLLWLLPSAFITQISPAPLPYAIFEPSGDQSGDRSAWSAPGVVVRGRWFDPSAFMTQMSPSRT